MSSTIPPRNAEADHAQQPEDGLSGNDGKRGADLGAPARMGRRAQAGYGKDAGRDHQSPESNAVGYRSRPLVDRRLGQLDGDAAAGHEQSDRVGANVEQQVARDACP